MDDLGHGSHVTGIIAATRNNGQGIAGLISDVKIMVCKILNASNSGTTSNLIAATNYSRLRGARIMNMSLQNYPYSTSLSAAFDVCEAAGVLLSVCAGNQGRNNDVTPNYPSSYDHPNIIAVGNHSRSNVRWAGVSGSNYGENKVDIFAPGTDILSPVLGTSYNYYTATSMATPAVTAAAAALKYTNPDWSVSQIKDCLLNSAIVGSAYQGICVSGGRLDFLNSISRAIRLNANHDSDGDGSPNILEYLSGARLDDASIKPFVVTDIIGNLLMITVPRPSRLGGYLEVETSSDLINWSTDGVIDYSWGATLSGAIPMHGENLRGFLRIRSRYTIPQ